jgi:DNA (cytosine-5)-methyltransferase 1
MNELALFAGAGGGILGGHLLGWRTVCAVEWDAYAASVLVARQNDGCLPPFPIWDDVQTFDGRPWRSRVDVVSGGFPCQDISAAGKGAGIDGARSGMWAHMARIIREVGPRYVLVENSPMLTLRGLGRVLGDLAAMGYDARWGVLGAVDTGAPHRRERIWIVGTNADSVFGRRQEALLRHRDYAQGVCGALADSNCLRELQPQGRQRDERRRACNCGQDVADADSAQRQGDERQERIGAKHADPCRTGWWITEPSLGRVAHGVAHRMDRLKAIGNGQVPAVAKLAWEILSQ